MTSQVSRSQSRLTFCARNSTQEWSPVTFTFRPNDILESAEIWRESPGTLWSGRRSINSDNFYSQFKESKMYAFGLCDEVREPGENPRRLETKSDRGGALEFRGRSANYMHRSTICKHMNNINYFADSGKQKVRTRICILKDQKF